MRSKNKFANAFHTRSILLLLAAGICSCQGGVSTFENIGANSENGSPITPPADSPSPDAAENTGDSTDLLTAEYLPNIYEGKAAVGVKNYEQIFNTMLSLIGLSDPNFSTSVQSFRSSVYQSAKLSLPSSNALNSFSPTQMLNVLNLSTSFCSALISGVFASNDYFPNVRGYTAGSIFFAGQDFYTPSTGAITDKVKLVRFFTNKFWGSSTDTSPERANSEADLVSLVNDLQAGGTSGFNVMKGVCAATLASPAVIFF